MEPTLIAALLGVLAVVSASVWWTARRAWLGVRQSTADLQTALKAAQLSLELAHFGEREAAWAATASSHRLQRTGLELSKANYDVERLEGDLDELRTRLGAADSDLDRLRAEFTEASTRCAVLEGDLDRSRSDGAAASQRLYALDGVEQRLVAVIRERDRLSAVVQRGEQLESELAALGQVHQELSATRAENATLRSRITAPALARADERLEIRRLESEITQLRLLLAEADRRTADANHGLRTARDQVTDLQEEMTSSIAPADRLIASEALRRDLELQLAALSATRSAEQRTSAERISALERLHGEVAERDRRIAALKDQRDRTVVEQPPARGSGDEAGTDKKAGTYAEWDRTLREQVAASVQQATARLQDRIDHLRLVIGEKERLLQAWEREQEPTATRGHPASVTDIKGIGPVIAAILGDNGIDSVQAIAALSESDIDRLGEAMPVYPGRIRRDDWVGQAQALLG